MFVYGTKLDNVRGDLADVSAKAKTLLQSSASFLAETSVSSPQKSFIYIIYNNIFWIKVSKKIVDLILKTKSLLCRRTINELSQLNQVFLECLDSVRVLPTCQKQTIFELPESVQRVPSEVPRSAHQLTGGHALDLFAILD